MIKYKKAQETIHKVTMAQHKIKESETIGK